MSHLLGFARLRVAARNPTTRVAIAAGIVLFAWWVSIQIRHLAAFVTTNPARLGFEMMGIGIGLAVFAIGIAYGLPGPVSRRLGLGRSRLPIGAVIALVLGTLGLSHAIQCALSLTAARALEGSVATGISRGLAGPSGWDFAIALLGSAIAPSLGEELLCRGLLQRGLGRWIGPVAAIAIASLAFGRLHGEFVHGAIATCLGAYLGFAAYWSDSTRPAIAGHAANNTVALLGAAGLAPALPAIPSAFAGLALAVIGIVWACLARPRGDPPPAPPSPLQAEPGPADA
jgi:membrane protease YdiL (CAAX protease family)